MAFLYGVLYLVLSTFPGLWTNVYHESVGIGGLNYIALGGGFTIGEFPKANRTRCGTDIHSRHTNHRAPERQVSAHGPAEASVSGPARTAPDTTKKLTPGTESTAA